MFEKAGHTVVYVDLLRQSYSQSRKIRRKQYEL